jgi:hypothetical protein
MPKGFHLFELGNVTFAFGQQFSAASLGIDSHAAAHGPALDVFFRPFNISFPIGICEI